MKKGQINLLVAIVGALGMVGASAFASWATISTKIQDTKEEIATVKSDVALNKNTENLHYLEIQKSLKRIEDLLKEKQTLTKEQQDYQDWINAPAK